jgi:hypothetical protein
VTRTVEARILTVVGTDVAMDIDGLHDSEIARQRMLKSREGFQSATRFECGEGFGERWSRTVPAVVESLIIGRSRFNGFIGSCRNRAPAAYLSISGWIMPILARLYIYIRL